MKVFLAFFRPFSDKYGLRFRIKLRFKMKLRFRMKVCPKHHMLLCLWGCLGLCSFVEEKKIKNFHQAFRRRLRNGQLL